jgi:hypothetical protein
LLELIAVVAMLAQRERIGMDWHDVIIPYKSGGIGERGQACEGEKCPDHTLDNG